MTKSSHIYVLRDPRTNGVRYVGKTAYPKLRLAAHLKRARSTAERRHVYNWIRALMREGMMPEFEVVQVCREEDQANAAEREWIARLRAQGVDLTNATGGGEGVLGLRHSDESRRRRSAFMTGTTQSAETRRKIGDATRGHQVPPELRANVAAANRRRVWTPEMRAKVSAAQKGKVISPEVRARMSASVRGRPPPSAETRVKMSASARRRPHQRDESGRYV